MYKNIYHGDFEETIEEPSKSNNEYSLNLDLFYEAEKSKLTWSEELNRYLELPCAHRNTNIALWWKTHSENFPNLSKMARDFFSMQATSVPCERLFSKAGMIITKERNRLDSESAKISLCLNSWLTCPILQEKLKSSISM